MQKHSFGARRRPVVTAAVALLGLGGALVTSGVASAGQDRTFVVITIQSANHDATLQVPTPACPPAGPNCEWMLRVYERTNTTQTLVGTATAGSGVLTVTYPADYCGEVQADALILLTHWRFKLGRRATVASSGCTPPAASSQLPLTGTTADGNVVTDSAITPAGSKHPADGAAQLPFTGIDLRPLALTGSTSILLGMLLLTSLEQRRRALKRVAYAVRPTAGVRRVSRVIGWLLGG